MNTSTQVTTKVQASPGNPPQKAKRSSLNGVDVEALFATINAVGGQPELAEFQFRATNQWVSGTHSRTRIESFSGAGGEHTHKKEMVFDGDHPAPLVGADNGATPVEMVLHALATCLTAGIGNIAAARGVELESVQSKVEGDINLLGLLGLSDKVRNGYQQVRVSIDVRGDASEEVLRKIVEQSKARSAVYDIITNGVPVAIEVNGAQ